MSSRTDLSGARDLDAILKRIREGDLAPVYLVAGDRVLAEPAAIRIGEALAAQVECSLEVHRRPAELSSLLADLKTYSLFSSAKVVVAVESAVLADAGAAAVLIDEALEAGSIEIADDLELSERQRRGASRLLQTLRLQQIDPFSGSAADVIGALPDAALKGANKPGGRSRRRGKKQLEEARQTLTTLLEAARSVELTGWAETELGELAEVLERGLPEGHALVLAESMAAAKHPIVMALQREGCFVAVGQVEAARGGGWDGLELLAEELERETGVVIGRSALEELARRTLQRVDSRAASGGTVRSDSTARFAGEYRKLATLVSEGEISLQLVENVVEDRGEEDAWKTLDAIGAGRTDEALARIRRLLSATEDPIAARLSFLALLAGFTRQLVAISGLIDELAIPRRSMSYPQFKNNVAPRLQADLEGEAKNPVAGLHPYRLYRAYAVACRVPSETASHLPARVLETELQLKGESRVPEAALASLVCDLTGLIRGR